MPWSRPTRHTSTRGKKGIPHDDPADPPRRRANRRRGHGTFATDRPPVAGVVGRESGEVRLEVIESASGAELEAIPSNGDSGLSQLGLENKPFPHFQPSNELLRSKQRLSSC